MGSLLFVFFLVFAWTLNQEDIARNAIPVTSIDQLVPGTTAKVNGTIVADNTVVIHEVVSDDHSQWSLVPFNLTDGTGSVYVLVGPLQGSGSYREIEPGVHDHDWWNGDAASIVGDVEPDQVGGVYIVARYIARTPTSYHRPGEFAVADGMFAMTATVFGAASITGFSLDWRRRKLHEENAPMFPHKVVGWPRCENCGEFVGPGSDACPGCRKPLSATRRLVVSPRDLSRLPTLRLRTAFEFRPKITRYIAIGAGLVVPAVLLSFFLGSLVVFGLVSSPTLLAVVLLSTLGPAFLSSYIGQRFIQQTVVLGPYRIESRRLQKRQVIKPIEVDRVFTTNRGGRRSHELMTRTGTSVSFGEGLSPADMEAARVWLRDLAVALGLEYHEGLSTLEEILPIVLRG